MNQRTMTHRMMDDARFLRALAILIAILTLLAFAPRYFVPLAGGDYQSPSIWMHPHAIAGFAFAAIFIVQPTLIARRQFGIHRALGRIAALVVIASLVSGLMVQLAMFPTAPDDFSNITGGAFRMFQSLPMLAIFFAAALIMRKRTDYHWRYMYQAAIAPIGTIVGRLYAFYTPLPDEVVGPLIGVTNLAFVALLPISDKLRYGRVHRASWIGLIAFILCQIVIAALILPSDWWLDIATGG